MTNERTKEKSPAKNSKPISHIQRLQTKAKKKNTIFGDGKTYTEHSYRVLTQKPHRKEKMENSNYRIRIRSFRV